MNHSNKSFNTSLGLGFLIAILGLIISLLNNDLYEYLCEEDGWAENITVGIFCVSLAYTIYLFVKCFRKKAALWRIAMTLLTLAIIFVIGEEISWGQRIFGIDSGDFFASKNTQGETNIHNLEIGGIKLNFLIFSQLFSVVMAGFFLLFPVFYTRNEHFKNLVNSFAIPVPRWGHTLLILGFTLSILAIPSPKKWEWFEMGFAIVFLILMLYPKNKKEIHF